MLTPVFRKVEINFLPLCCVQDPAAPDVEEQRYGNMMIEEDDDEHDGPVTKEARAAATPLLSDQNCHTVVGPVSRLAQLAAAREEEVKAAQRIAERAAERATVHATAVFVGETARAMQAAVAVFPTSSSSPRSTPNSNVRSSTSFNNARSSPLPTKSSVASRARAAADLPSSPTRLSLSNDGQQRYLSSLSSPSNNNGNNNEGVLRGSFSPSQVRQVLEAWGKDDDTEDEGYWSQGFSDDDRSDSSECRFKNSLKKSSHHLMYTMSQSPETRTSGGTTPTNYDDTASNLEEEEEFYYQHHRVSAYQMAASVKDAPPSQPQLNDNGDNDINDEEEEDSKHNYDWGLFASAKSWLRSQRDRLHQMELERQVEEQRRILLEEGRKQRELAAERRINGNVASSTTLTKTKMTMSVTHHSPIRPFHNDEDKLIYSPEMPYLMCGFGDPRQHANLDNSDKIPAIPRFDQSGNVVEMIRSSDSDENDVYIDKAKRAYRVSSPRLTRSGEGMTVKVEYPRSDDDDEVCHIDNGNTPIFDEEKEYVDDDGGGVVDDKNNDASSSLQRNVIKIVLETEQRGISIAPTILHSCHMTALIESGALPQSLNYCKWKRLYSLARDGDSFEQFLRLVKGHDRTVLVVRTTHGRLFGGYADTRWEAKHSRRSANDFYGSAQACLFRFDSSGASDATTEDNISISVYRWSGINRYIQLCDSTKRALAFGGGGDDGYFGLCIEDDFKRGTTGYCSTFENEALCEDGYFEIEDLEVWGFILDF